jgi:hypothetical protein
MSRTISFLCHVGPYLRRHVGPVRACRFVSALDSRNKNAALGCTMAGGPGGPPVPRVGLVAVSVSKARIRTTCTESCVGRRQGQRVTSHRHVLSRRQVSSRSPASFEVRQVSSTYTQVVLFVSPFFYSLYMMCFRSKSNVIFCLITNRCDQLQRSTA